MKLCEGHSFEQRGGSRPEGVSCQEDQASLARMREATRLVNGAVLF